MDYKIKPHYQYHHFNKVSRVIYECNFDNVQNNAVGCDGVFAYDLNGQLSGVTEHISAVSTDLKCDITDLTSTSKFVLKYYNFCAKHIS